MKLPLAIIVGGGPAGLVLANSLQQQNEDFYLIESKTTSSNLSKATGIHRNTLKLFDKLNLTQKIFDNSILLNGNNLYVDNRLVKRIIFEQGTNINDKNISIDQAVLEDILEKNLSNSKNCIWGKKFISFEANENSVTVQVEDLATGIIQSISAQFLIAADGAKSLIRKNLNISFEGETTEELSFTFDAKIISQFPTNEMAMFTKIADRLVIVPLPFNRYKFAGKVSRDWLNQNELKESNLTSLVLERSNIEINPETITGLSCYHTASRIASSMRDKQVILIGDAAHVFFPAGGYGLNTAINTISRK